jgi:hypothetical protein
MNENKILKDIDSIRNWFNMQQVYKPDSDVYFWTLSSLSAQGIRKMMNDAMIDDTVLKERMELLRRIAPESKII